MVTSRTSSSDTADAFCSTVKLSMPIKWCTEDVDWFLSLSSNGDPQILWRPQCTSRVVIKWNSIAYGGQSFFRWQLHNPGIRAMSLLLPKCGSCDYPLWVANIIASGCREEHFLSTSCFLPTWEGRKGGKKWWKWRKVSNVWSLALSDVLPFWGESLRTFL